MTISDVDTNWRREIDTTLRRLEQEPDGPQIRVRDDLPIDVEIGPGSSESQVHRILTDFVREASFVVQSVVGQWSSDGYRIRARCAGMPVAEAAEFVEFLRARQ